MTVKNNVSDFILYSTDFTEGSDSELLTYCYSCKEEDYAWRDGTWIWRYLSRLVHMLQMKSWTCSIFYLQLPLEVLNRSKMMNLSTLKNKVNWSLIPFLLFASFSWKFWNSVWILVSASKRKIMLEEIEREFEGTSRLY